MCERVKALRDEEQMVHATEDVLDAEDEIGARHLEATRRGL